MPNVFGCWFTVPTDTANAAADTIKKSHAEAFLKKWVARYKATETVDSLL